MVYTVPDAQGQGYAKWLTAQCRDEGSHAAPEILLYADADSPRSNAAYRRIGFEKMGVIREIKMFKDGMSE